MKLHPLFLICQEEHVIEWLCWKYLCQLRRPFPTVDFGIRQDMYFLFLDKKKSFYLLILSVYMYYFWFILEITSGLHKRHSNPTMKTGASPIHVIAGG